MRRWVAFFSQTGSEILEVSRALNRVPDKVIYNTNFGKGPPINEELQAVLKASEKVIYITPNRPEVFNYKDLLVPGDLVTLHGWLRIVPPVICDNFEIYNGHPGLITEFPELKGQNPQQKAIDLELKTSGCVIHEVTAEVDAGKILKTKEVSIEGMETGQVFEALHDASIQLWVEFLKEKV